MGQNAGALFLRLTALKIAVHNVQQCGSQEEPRYKANSDLQNGT